MPAITASRGANVIRLVSDGNASLAISGQLKIDGIMFLAGTASSILIQDKDASGTRLYFRDGNNDVYDEVPIIAMDGIYVTVVNATADLEVFIYLE